MSDTAAAIRLPEAQIPWYVLRVASGCEEMVTEWLRLYLKAEVRLFKVRISKRVKIRNRSTFRIVVEETPLFPGYLFVRSTQLHKLEQNGKIIGPIRSGQDFATIRDSDLQAVALGCNDKDVFAAEARNKPITAGDSFRFMPGSVFGDAVVKVVQVLKNLDIKAEVTNNKFGTKRMVTVSAQTISSALMKA